MREIKFRAWDKPQTFANEQKLDGRMVYSKLKRNENYMTSNDVGWSFRICDVNAPIMQYTGLKDKNGKEIYEGDILRWLAIEVKTGRVVVDELVIAEYSEQDARYFCYLNGLPENLFQDRTKRWEIIGNIYENPELLNGGENAKN